MIPSRLGMMIIYAPALGFSLYQLSQPSAPRMTLVQGLIGAHFAKRCAEVMKPLTCAAHKDCQLNDACSAGWQRCPDQGARAGTLCAQVLRQHGPFHRKPHRVLLHLRLGVTARLSQPAAQPTGRPDAFALLHAVTSCGCTERSPRTFWRSRRRCSARSARAPARTSNRLPPHRRVSHARPPAGPGAVRAGAGGESLPSRPPRAPAPLGGASRLRPHGGARRAGRRARCARARVRDADRRAVRARRGAALPV